MTADQPMLVDLPENAPACAECGRVLTPAGTGRPARYCSATCRSAAHRRRRSQEAQARQEAPPAPMSARRGRLMELADAVRQATGMLADVLDAEAVGGDESALKALRAAAAHLLDQAALEKAARDETLGHEGRSADQADAVPLGAADGFRGGNETLQDSGLFGPTVFRAGDETKASPDRAPVSHTVPTQVPARPGEEETAAVITPGVAAVAGRGQGGPAVQDPAAAVASQGEALASSGDGARLRDLVGRRLAQQAAVRPGPRPDAGVGVVREGRPEAGPEAAGGTVAVPSAPLLRGLRGTTDFRIRLEPGLFGDWWALEGWHDQADIYLVTGEGHAVGWVERGVPGLGGRWAAIYEECFLGDPATQEPALHDTPEQAAFTVQTAYLRNL